MNPTPIHVKLEYLEALSSKKSLLSSEKNLLRSARFMSKYYSLRLNELQIKERLHRKLKETQMEISKIEKTFPRAEVPKRFKKEDEEKYSLPKKQQIKKEKQEKNIESELAEIQRKLRMLQ